MAEVTWFDSQSKLAKAKLPAKALMLMYVVKLTVTQKVGSLLLLKLHGVLKQAVFLFLAEMKAEIFLYKQK